VIGDTSLFSLLNIVNNSAEVDGKSDLIVFVLVMLFILAGITVEALLLIGTIVLAAIHVLIKTSLTAFWVLFTNFEYLFGLLVDSLVFKLFKLVIVLD
jgi:hypothetical protein